VVPEIWLYFWTSVQYIYFVSCFGLPLGHVLHFRGFAITLRRTTIGRTLLDDWSAYRSGLYLTIHTYRREIYMPPVGFEPTIPGSERPKTQVLDRTDTEFVTCQFYFSCKFWPSSICALRSKLGLQFYFSLGPENFQAGPVICLEFFRVSDAWINYFMDFPCLFMNIFACYFETFLIGVTTDSLYISINS
jgi:hypothetical protein